MKKYLETSLGGTCSPTGAAGIFCTHFLLQCYAMIQTQAKNIADDADCNIHEVADERDYLVGEDNRSRSNDGRSACSPNTSTSITTSGKVDTRIRILFDKRRRSLDRIEQIRAEERRKLRQICTFKPDIGSKGDFSNTYSRINSKVPFASLKSSQKLATKKEGTAHEI